MANRSGARGELRKLELRYRLYGRLLETIAGIIHKVTPWAAGIVIAYYAHSSIQSLAGHATFADIGIKFLADFRISEVVSYAVGAGGVRYGARMGKLKKDAIDRMAGRIKELETKMDPGRSSSRLTPRGETRSEDKP